jgi:hypothetical protein
MSGDDVDYLFRTAVASPAGRPRRHRSPRQPCVTDLDWHDRPGSGPGEVPCVGGTFVSIIRVGLAETKHFAEGYEAIFGKKKDEKKKDESGARAETTKKKKGAKKKK